MKQHLRSIRFFFFFITALVICSCCTFALASTSTDSIDIHGVTYQLQHNEQYVYADLGDDTVSIVLYVGEAESVDLNHAVPGKKVVRVEDSAFLSNESFLGDFHGKQYEIEGKKYVCKTNITEIILPDSLISIGYMSFVDNKLTDVDIPAGIQYVGYHAFAGNPIAEIPYIPEHAETSAPFSNSKVTTVTFDAQYTKVPDYFLTFASMKNLVLHEGITSIGATAFDYCSMKSVELPQSLTYIGDKAFVDCKSLTSIVIPDTVTQLGAGTFTDCTRLNTVELPAALETLQEKTFIGCSRLKTVKLKENLKHIGIEAFSGCSALAKITLPDSLQKIDNYAFYQCKNLKSIVIPPNVTTIGIEAFSGCKALSKVSLPASVTSISNDAFDNCAKKITFEVIDGTYAAQWAAEQGYKCKVIYPVTGITLSSDTAVVATKKTLSLKATVEPGDATNKKLEWLSTNTDVATVKAGKVTAKSVGSCDIICKATDGSCIQTVCHVDVIQMVTSLKAAASKLTISPGETIAAEITIKPADATDPRLAWSSSDEQICTVDANGNITAVGAGRCDITCSTTDGSNKSVKIKVQVPTP